MKAAITAVTGQLGKAIARETVDLLSAENVVGLARTPGKAEDLGIEVRPGDYDDEAGMRDSLRSIDVLLLVSGMVAPDARIEQHRNAIRAARDAGVQKIVYTSIQGAEGGTAFSPVVQSNRQTERDVRDSGLDWVIGRNGIYIEPDVEYLDAYVKAGGITNCAGDGKCGYTTRSELGYAYARMIAGDEHERRTYNLHGEAITQAELADYLNGAFGTDLSYTPVSVEAYRRDRIAELGEFMGTIIAGIYQGIREGAADNPSRFRDAAGREHRSWDSYFEGLKRRAPTS